VLEGRLLDSDQWSRIILSPYPRNVIVTLRGEAFKWSDGSASSKVSSMASSLVAKEIPFETDRRVEYAVDDFEVWFPRLEREVWFGMPTIVAMHGDVEVLTPTHWTEDGTNG
jgi:hypothetical protein